MNNRHYRPRMYSTANIDEMWAPYVWCRETFGRTAEWHTWHRHKGRLYFRNEQDYILFLLRWS
jgi:hypothetical protein